MALLCAAVNKSFIFSLKVSRSDFQVFPCEISLVIIIIITSPCLNLFEYYFVENYFHNS